MPQYSYSFPFSVTYLIVHLRDHSMTNGKNWLIFNCWLRFHITEMLKMTSLFFYWRLSTLLQFLFNDCRDIGMVKIQNALSWTLCSPIRNHSSSMSVCHVIPFEIITWNLWDVLTSYKLLLTQSLALLSNRTWELCQRFPRFAIICPPDPPTRKSEKPV